MNNSGTGYSHLTEIPEPIRAILRDRGIVDDEQLRRFISPAREDLYSPWLLRDMDRAVSRIRQALDSGESIAIYSDSDLDGLTSLTILSDLLKKLGCGRIFQRYPRDEEDYGLTCAIIDEFHQEAATLLITLDSGIRDIDEIRYARLIGIDTIVTDHHEPDTILPECIIVNPRRHDCLYPYKNLAGVGVAFKLCHALLMSYLPVHNKNFLLLFMDSGKCSLALVRNDVAEYISPETESGEIELILENRDIDTLILWGEWDGYPYIESFQGNIYRYSAMTGNNHDREGLPGTGSGQITVFPDPISIQEMLRGFLELQRGRYKKITAFINNALQMVAIGTVADVMPLTDENRTLVSMGLVSLASTEHRGLNLLMKGAVPTSHLIGWTIAPILNTPGRYGRSSLTAGFLMESGPSADVIYQELLDLNEDRKNLVQWHIESISNDVNLPVDGEGVLCISLELPDGMAGLLASRLSDMTGRPVIVLALPGRDGMIKGSGRSKSQDGFFNLIEDYGNRFERVGGHDRAFGFTIRLDLVDDFKREITGVQLPTVREPAVRWDYELEPKSITLDFIRNLSLLEPYGPGNEEPVFMTSGCTVRDFRRMGEKGIHGRLNIRENQELHVVGWNLADRMSAFGVGQKVSLLYTLEINTYNNHSSPQLVLKNITGDRFR